MPGENGQPERKEHPGEVRIQLVFRPLPDGTQDMEIRHSPNVDALTIPGFLMAAQASCLSQINETVQDMADKLDEKRIITPGEFLTTMRKGFGN